MFDEYAKAVPFVVDVGGAKNPRKLLLSDANFQGLFDQELVCNGDSEGTLVELFENTKSDLILLSQEELKKVGSTHSMRNQEVFLPPLVMTSFLALLTLCAVMSLLGFFL